MSSPRHSLSLLRDPNARLIVAARFVSRVGGVAGFFVGIWGKAAYSFDATATELALVMAVIGVTGVAGSAIAGVLVDRFDPRKVILVGEAAFVPSILALVVVDSIGQMALLVGPASLFGTMVFTAVSSFPPFLTRDPVRLERLNAAVEAAGTLAFVLGPAVGAGLVRYADVDAVFVLDALTSLVAVAFVRRVQLIERVPRARSGAVQSGFADLVEGLRFAREDGAIRLLIVTSGLTFLSFGMFGALEPLFFRDVLGEGPEMLGYVNALFGAGLLAGSAAYARLPSRWTSLPTVGAFTVAAGIGAAAYTAGSTLRVVVLGAVYWSVVLGLLMPMQRTLAHLRSPEPLVGRIMGVFGILGQAGELLPLAIAPAVAATIGVQATLVASGLIVAALGVPATVAAVRARRRSGHEVGAEVRLDPASAGPGSR